MKSGTRQMSVNDAPQYINIKAKVKRQKRTVLSFKFSAQNRKLKTENFLRHVEN